MHCWESWALTKLFLGFITLDFWALKLASAVQLGSSTNPVEHPGLSWGSLFSSSHWSRTLLPKGCSEVASNSISWGCEHFGFSVSLSRNMWPPQQKGPQDLRGLQNTTTFTYLNLCTYLSLVACFHLHTTALQYSQLWTVRDLLEKVRCIFFPQQWKLFHMPPYFGSFC